MKEPKRSATKALQFHPKKLSALQVGVQAEVPGLVTLGNHGMLSVNNWKLFKIDRLRVTTRIHHFRKGILIWVRIIRSFLHTRHITPSSASNAAQKQIPISNPNQKPRTAGGATVYCSMGQEREYHQPRYDFNPNPSRNTESKPDRLLASPTHLIGQVSVMQLVFYDTGC